MPQKQLKTRVMFPIGVKLVVIISILVLISLGAVIALVSFLSSADVRRTAEHNNFTINRRAGSQAEGSFKSVQAAVIFYLKMIETSGQISSSGNRQIDNMWNNAGMEEEFFKHNNNIAAIQTEYFSSGKPVSIFISNENFILSNNIDTDMAKRYFNSGIFSAEFRPEIMTLYNASPYFRQSLLGAVFVLQSNSGVKTAKILFTTDELSESFGTGTNTSFIVTELGDVLLHPDTDLVLGGANLSSLKIVNEIQHDVSDLQTSFIDNADKNFFGAYYHINGTNSIVITTIPYDIVFEAVQRITIQNIFLTGTVLFLAILFIWFFSKTISRPARLLAAAALQIEGGNFEIDLKPENRDELGLLTESFNKMSGALTVFGRFTNKEIAIRAMNGEIKPGGFSKNATIFFSDIRGFTEKSENFTKAFGKDASDRIVRWLNEYFTYMVDCVEKTGGAIDKFIGDAVMAHWGTAFSAGSPAADAFNCVKAALMMRSALHNLNNSRKKDDPGSPIIKIGCGINTGVVTAGQIGSEQRMEYTVIGDPVNLASRTEALNKPMGTDILITENTYNLISGKLITEEMPSVTVKGKEKPVRLFAVVNIRGVKGPKTLSEVRELLNIAAPDLSKVNTNAEEKKYKIQSD